MVSLAAADISEASASGEDIAAVMTQGFALADAKLTGLGRMQPQTTAKQGKLYLDKSGSTAVCCLLTLDKICIANVGDSRAVIARRRASTNDAGGGINNSPAWSRVGTASLEAEALSTDHKPHLESERVRILASGSK